jgi:hypothetical protein
MELTHRQMCPSSVGLGIAASAHVTADLLEGQTPVAQARQVGLESVLFVLTHVHPGHEARWNEWYENDHFYAGCVLGPGVLSGARWHAPAKLREVRFVADEQPFLKPWDGGGLATYFLTVPGGSREFREWNVPQVTALRRAGRHFAERDMINCAFYRYSGCLRGAGASTVAPHVTQLRPFPALFVTLATGVARWPESGPDLPAGSVTLVLEWNAEPFGPADQPDLSPFAPVTMLLTFLESAPPADGQGTAALAHTMGGAVGLHPMWASAFLPIIPGDSGLLRDDAMAQMSEGGA